MGETDKTDKNDKKFLSKFLIVFIMVVALIVIVWFFLNNGTETKTSSSITNSEVSLLRCTFGDTENAFFTSRTSLNHEHEIKVMARDNVMSEMTYNYNATYNSERAAEDDDARMHADYNFYMGDNNTDPESLNPVFSPVKQKDKITLHLKMEKLNAVTGKLFFLSSEDISDIRTKKNFEIGDLEKLYKSKGFSCEYTQ